MFSASIWMNWAKGNDVLATARAPLEKSIPSNEPDCPSFFITAAETAPVPHATSRTLAPVRISAALTNSAVDLKGPLPMPAHEE
jgi:hypothetical protein